MVYTDTGRICALIEDAISYQSPSHVYANRATAEPRSFLTMCSMYMYHGRSEATND